MVEGTMVEDTMVEGTMVEVAMVEEPRQKEVVALKRVSLIPAVLLALSLATGTEKYAKTRNHSSRSMPRKPNPQQLITPRWVSINGACVLNDPTGGQECKNEATPHSNTPQRHQQFYHGNSTLQYIHLGFPQRGRRFERPKGWTSGPSRREDSTWAGQRQTNTFATRSTCRRQVGEIASIVSRRMLR